MPRKRQPVEAVTASEPAPPLAIPEPEPEPVPVVVMAAPAPASYSVGVRNRCPWSTVRSAGTDWGRLPTILPAGDPRLPELRRCEWLTVTEA